MLSRNKSKSYRKNICPDVYKRQITISRIAKTVVIPTIISKSPVSMFSILIDVYKRQIGYILLSIPGS